MKEDQILGNMKPFTTDQRILTWLCVIPAPQNTSMWKKQVYTALALSLMLANLSNLSSSVMFIVKFLSINLQAALIALHQVLATIPMANTIIMAFFYRHKIPPVFDKLTHIYKKRMYSL